jgi:hypothetical protein
MPSAKRNLRGLQDIRTLSGRVDEASLPHRAYMKLACLEMEKERRKAERNSAVQRVRNIDARIRDIETEQAAVRRTMAGEADGPGRASPGSGAEPGHPRGKKRRFTVKY